MKKNTLMRLREGMQRTKILLIEDSPTVASYVEDILRGYEVAHFKNPLQLFKSV